MKKIFAIGVLVLSLAAGSICVEPLTSQGAFTTGSISRQTLPGASLYVETQGLRASLASTVLSHAKNFTASIAIAERGCVDSALSSSHGCFHETGVPDVRTAGRYVPADRAPPALLALHQ